MHSVEINYHLIILFLNFSTNTVINKLSDGRHVELIVLGNFKSIKKYQ